MRRLPPGGLYGILDTRWLSSEALPKAAEAFLAGGCSVLQLRMKEASDTERLSAQRAVCDVAAKHPSTVWLAINDRADLAGVLLREAPDNVVPILHLGQDDMAPRDARRLLGDDLIVGLSTHNFTQVLAANEEPVDYLGFGPVFETETKAKPDPTTGIPGLESALSVAAKPVVAIGGVTEDRVQACRKAGAVWVVVVGGLLRDAILDDEAGQRDLGARVATLVEVAS
jgi:thiamine-phosphate pyrophosphorylase